MYTYDFMRSLYVSLYQATTSFSRALISLSRSFYFQKRNDSMGRGLIDSWTVVRLEASGPSQQMFQSYSSPDDGIVASYRAAWSPRRVGRNPQRSSRISPLFLRRARSFDTRRYVAAVTCVDAFPRQDVYIPERIKAGVGFSHTHPLLTPFLPSRPSRQILAVNRRRRCVRWIKGLMLAVADQK